MNGDGRREIIAGMIANPSSLNKKGIVFDKIDFHRGSNSLIYKGFSLSSAIPPRPLILKIVDSENLDLRRMDTVFRRFADFLPRVHHYELMDRWVCFFIDEIHTFGTHQDLGPRHVIDILRIVKRLSRHRIHYGDISHTNFGHLDNRILILDFTDLIDARPGRLRCQPEYAPPELPFTDGPLLSPEARPRSLSFIFAMFVVGTQLSQTAANNIQCLMNESRAMVRLNNHDPVSIDRLNRVLGHLVRKIIEDSLNEKLSATGSRPEIQKMARWSPVLTRMLDFDWHKRPSIERITL
jgi:hypothetical protein